MFSRVWKSQWDDGEHEAFCHPLVPSTVPFHFAASSFPFPLMFFTFALFFHNPRLHILAEAGMGMVRWSTRSPCAERGCLYAGGLGLGDINQEDGMRAAVGWVLSCCDF